MFSVPRSWAFPQVHALEGRSLLSGSGADSGADAAAALAGDSLPGRFIDDIAGLDVVKAVEVDADGKIVVLGNTTPPGAPLGTFPHVFLARYHPDGTPDARFGKGGKVVTDFADFRRGHAMDIGADGKIIVGGTALSTAGGEPVPGNTDSADFALARFNPDGSLDRRFGDGGTVVTAVAPNWDETVEALAVLGDGSLVVGWSANVREGAGAHRGAIARYRPDGRLDRSFGQDGLVHLGAGYSSRVMAVQGDGGFVLGGSANGKMAVARFRADGSPDPSFAGGGLAEAGGTPGPGRFTGIVDIVVLGDGRIVAAGASALPPSLAPPLHPRDNLGDVDLVLARFNPDGTLDAAFGGGDGVAIDSLGVETLAADLALAGDGSLYVAGKLNDADGFDVAESLFLARYDPLGQRDAGFATDGHTLFRFTDGTNITADVPAGVALQSDGRIIVAATAGGREDVGLARFDADGSFDETFGAGRKPIPKPPPPPVPPPAPPVTAKLVRRTLVVRGSREADTLLLRLAAGSSDTDGPMVEVHVGEGSYRVHRFELTNARRIVIHGGGGDDSIVIEPSITTPALLHGGPGDDRLTGGGGDALFGGHGNDTLTGGGGNDRLFGASGDDRFFNRDPVTAGGITATGRDTVLGGPGHDTADRDDPDDLLRGVEG